MPRDDSPAGLLWRGATGRAETEDATASSRFPPRATVALAEAAAPAPSADPLRGRLGHPGGHPGGGAALSDTQGEADRRNIAIQRVGVRGLRYPAVSVGEAGEYPTVATCELSVGLAPERRGAHMSRLVEALHAWDRRLTRAGVERFLTDLAETQEALEARVAIGFHHFQAKRAPVSGAEALVDYPVTVTARLADGAIETRLRVTVPVTSLCPCSKAISDLGAHNQRSHIVVTARVGQGIWIDELIALAEAEASCALYSLLKRDDEKYVTERAYANPKFVEDLVRDVAARLGEDRRIDGFSVAAETFESIHNHSAFALVEQGA